MTGSATTIDDTPDYANSYVYDAIGRVTGLTQQVQDDGYDVTAKHVDFTYNPASQITNIARYAGTTNAGTLVATSDFSYDDAGRLTEIAHDSSDFDETHGYQYDAANRVTQHTTAYGDFAVNYGYDQTGQLTSADYDGGSLYDEGYAFD